MASVWTGAACAIPTCRREPETRGWCGMHYARFRRWGDPLFTLLPTRGRSFLERVLMAVPDGDGQSCWLFQGTLTNTGYGRIGWRQDGQRRFGSAHRIVFESLAVTSTENVLRGIAPPALNAAKTHCVRGHEFTPDNTYVYPKRGTRNCRTCRLEWKKANRVAS